MKIYVIAGRAGSGKSEVAKLLKEQFIYQKKNVVITSFSKYLKMYATEMTNWDGNDSNKPRKFLQDLGSYIRHDLNQPYYFIDRIIDDVKVYERDFDVCVIADARFPEEIEELKNNFDDVTSVLVINQFGQSKLSVEEQSHETENALDDYENFDFTIVNDDFDKLKQNVNKILNI